ncbi:hypothetical protein PoB_001736100 [Plakobranchus ocellatus]|uniref:Uncharacterized protein n=1 Tax=Plakobranchus ocellatus TaxID=259542 RepID=A0AAV3Z4R3_9GAST|nr:hypothetical protein PoB_001736100 [Plakobranchus ocellatus]
MDTIDADTDSPLMAMPTTARSAARQTGDGKAQQQQPGVGGTVASKSALKSALTFCRKFEPHHGCPGLTEGLKT